MSIQPQYGSSAWACDYIVEQQFRQLRPTTVVDFGAGEGKYGRLLRPLFGRDCHITAVEGFAPAADKLVQQPELYDVVCHALLQDWLQQEQPIRDLAIFGDVLEHLTSRQIHRVLRRALSCFRHVIIAVPLHDVFQDDVYGNSLEVHRAYITTGFFRRYHPVEQHIVAGHGYRIMNLLIASPTLVPRTPWRYRWVHPILVVLQRFSLARPAVAIAKKLVR